MTETQEPLVDVGAVTKAAFTMRNRNPDVLSCIANLSNDEVFTPPDFVNRMLDTLAEGWAAANDGADIWADSKVTFLDPFTKSGVFLREITNRLVAGLAEEIPDLEQRVDHILTKQVFGIAITEITALLARRSLYCSKWANGPHSIAKSFGSSPGIGGADGHVWFERTEHTWVGGTDWVYTADAHGNQIKKFTDGKCRYCGTSQKAFDRDAALETHAYALIHTDDASALVRSLFGGKMQFDVIIGNPPYQLKDGGYGTSAAPIYDKFVEQAMSLEPRMLSMIIPSRWFSGGKGLDDFREKMLNDRRVRSIDDYISAVDVFPSGAGKGGICYFLWDRDNEGDCAVTTHFKGWEDSTSVRPLLEEGVDVFVRFNEGLSILRKVVEYETGQGDHLGLPEDKRFDTLVSSSRPFGLRTFFQGREVERPGDLLVYQNGGTAFIARSEIATNAALIDRWKVYIGAAAPGTGNKDTYPHRVLPSPFAGAPGSICTETYLAIGPLDSAFEADSVLSYLSCRFTRLLILLHKPSQHTSRKVYKFVPRQTWDRTWTDEALYEMYGLDETEIEFIEKIVRPMELGDID